MFVMFSYHFVCLVRSPDSLNFCRIKIVVNIMMMNIKLKNFMIMLRFFKKREVFVSNGGLLIGVGGRGDRGELDTIGGILLFSDNVIV